MLKSFVMALCLLTAGTAAADERMPGFLKAANVSFGAAVASDLATTHYNLSRGHHELNRTTNWLGDRPTATVALAGAIDVTEAWLWNRYVGKRHPKLAAIGLYASTAWRVKSGVRNYRIRPATYCGPATSCVR